MCLINDFTGYISNNLDILNYIAIFFGIYTIVVKNPIWSILSLIALFTTISVYLMFINMIFIGLSYLLVYVGAVSILFLFILMLINIRISELVSSNHNYIPLALISLILLTYILKENIIITELDLFNKIVIYLKESKVNTIINFSNGINWENITVDIGHIGAIGNIIYSQYSIWLIIVSLILLLSMVGAIVITLK